MNRALYLNKFHMMHKGLVAAVEEMTREPGVDEVVLGICSSQFDDRHPSPEKTGLHNVLRLEERIEAMDVALSHIDFPIRYVAIPDTFPIDKSVPENRWIDSVIRRSPDFGIVFTDRYTESSCFSHKGYEVRQVPRKVLFSDHCVRDKIARREIWQPYVPDGVVELFRGWDLEGRLEKLYGERPLPDDVSVTYEWRSFDEPSHEVTERIMKFPDIARVMLQDDYLVSLTSAGINLKYRNGIKVKELLKSAPYISLHGGEEHLDVFTSYRLEHERDYNRFCKHTRFPVPRRSLPHSVDGLVRHVPDRPNPYCMHLQVDKKRVIKSFDGVCAVELSEVDVLGTRHITVGLESGTKSGLIRAKKELGLEGMNTNYTQFFEGLLYSRYGDELYRNMWVR